MLKLANLLWVELHLPFGRKSRTAPQDERMMLRSIRVDPLATAVDVRNSLSASGNIITLRMMQKTESSWLQFYESQARTKIDGQNGKTASRICISFPSGTVAD